MEKDMARTLVEDTLSSGKALLKFKEWIRGQGGNTEWIDNPNCFPKAEYSFDIVAEKEGYISSMDAEKIGISAVVLGAGRETKEDTIDMSAGIILQKKTGDKILKGDVIATLYTNKEPSFSSAENIFRESVVISKEKPQQMPLIYNII